MVLVPARRRAAAWLAVAASVALAACRSTPPPPVEPPSPPPVTRLGHFKAVLINGGGKPAINFQSHLTHVRTLVDFLRANDVAPEDIAIFSSDGADPTPDLATRDDDTEPDAWLLPPAIAHRLRPAHTIDSTVE